MSIYTQRLASQIEFVKQCAIMKKTPIQNFVRHSEFTGTEEQIIGLPGISLNIINDSSDEVWLRLERLHENSAPEPKNVLLKNWIKFPIKFDDLPVLKEKLSEKNLIDNIVVAYEEAFTPFEVEDRKQSELEVPLEKEIYLKDFFKKEALEIELRD